MLTRTARRLGLVIATISNKQVSLKVVVALAALAMVVGACSQPASDSVSDLSTFMEVGRVYGAAELEQALTEATIGRTPTNAIVPLVFTSDGRLLSAKQTLRMFEEVHKAALGEEKLITSQEDTRVSWYFTTTEVYASVIARLEAQGRVSQREFNAFSSENVTPLMLPSLESESNAWSGSIVFVFNPYMAVTSTGLQPTTNPDCLVRCSQRCAMLRYPPAVLACFVICAAFC